ncbi:MAG TPA: SagB/ThcOx family dehydrogenase [Candidatus Paceibacterota bacterium]|nr:SagB/ThcOx family dehydrogenase [Candidatus Paceibacterota bacterium]
MATFISRIHAYLRRARAPHDTPAKQHSSPASAAKAYRRMPRIALPAPGALSVPLHQALGERASFFECAGGRALTRAELGTLLGNALGMRDGERRRYPSGGGLFPIETYLIGTVLEGHPPGAFHYQPNAHELEFLWETPAAFASSDLMRTEDAPRAPIVIVFTSVWERSAVKYGDFSYLLGLLEAGHMAQNLLLAATALGFGSRPMAGFDDERIAALLDLDESVEQPIYAVLLCPGENGAMRKAPKRETNGE